MEKLEWLCVSNFPDPWNILKFSKVKISVNRNILKSSKVKNCRNKMVLGLSALHDRHAPSYLESTIYIIIA